MSNTSQREFPAWRLDTSDIDAEALPLLADVDVVVVGAGAAGVAAATIAAEAGCTVVLVEKYGFAGGAAVAGMSGTICGLYLASEAPRAPERLVQGFTDRFRSELRRRGGLTDPQRYGKTWTEAHDPLVWRETADALLETAGVRLLFHTGVVAPVMDSDTLRGVVVESNAGRSVVRARRVIDASGDAAVVARAGGATFFGDDGTIQNPTMFFRLGNVDTDAYEDYYGPDTICPPEVTEALEQARERGADLPRSKIWIFRTPRPGELLVNATRLIGRDGRMLNVIDPEDFTEAELYGRRQVREYETFLRANLPGCENSFVVDTGVEAGIRQTRSIVGVDTLRNEDVVACRKRPDGVVRSAWPIELHSGDHPKLTWLYDDFYEVPYQALVPRTGENVIVAGRCLSAQHEALASARVTAQCFEYGHAAAAATLMSLETDTPYRRLDGQDVRARMRLAGSDL
ncbi:glycine/D-amino acid oxidase-like deaminating enzyme [Streptomyces sp. B3I7]|uniref:FAD-dependent oxidoreductase n=1 Tax=Streptomyces sp. B3I7 TaxID=3042269 RepID=UPI00277D7DEE|nr:FAD-dependent oxidoreductase [Streptomyces sp. B3I7]MDQ0809704.1 glycine/D-amino acid oxidase-like deaminating enzyme [Streptomyces sp. B3I7]